MVKAIIFDLDGVLVDACDLHYKALNLALQRHNFHIITYQEHLSNYNGMPTKAKLKKIGYSDLEISKISATKQELTLDLIYTEIFEDPKKVELLKYLKEQKYKIGVCSNSLNKSIKHFLQASKLAKYIDFYVGNDDVKNPKPAPDMYLHMLKLLDVTSSEAIAVEDTELGASSSQGAKIETIVVASYDEVTIDLFKKYKLL